MSQYYVELTNQSTVRVYYHEYYTANSTDHCAYSIGYGLIRQKCDLYWQTTDFPTGNAFLAGEFDGHTWYSRGTLMPATSKAFRRLAAIAEHHPEQVSRKNRGVLGMTKKQLHDFASTPERGLPYKKKKRKGPFSDYEMP